MPSPRKTIGSNPLDAVIPDLRPLHENGANGATKKPARSTPAAEEIVVKSARKERLTIHLPTELIDRIKNAVFWTPGLTLAGLGEEALRHFVEDMEARRGSEFEERLSELKGGRPIKLD